MLLKRGRFAELVANPAADATESRRGREGPAEFVAES
jgi:hypothetical protein